MNILKIIIAAAVALVVGFFGGTVVAGRDGGKANILFLDQQKVLLESEAGKSIDEQLKKLGEEVATELQTIQAQIEAEGQQLQADRENYSEEELARRVQFLRQKAQGLEQLQQIRQAELQQARANAIAELAEEWEPLSEDLYEERGGFVLMEKQNVLFSNEEGDITEALIAALDEEVTSIDVVKPDLQGQLLAQQRAQQQAAQAAAAAQQQPAQAVPAGENQ
ncbi:OmpH family outer membrane protein [Parvularcula maris]|uniref:OmpH family outer membrane protein n=1 Tax=Parvularcula maris TaxID=2965077 RepID=A0A9X2RJ51_9PROT|nr:OmpH family outer membrane protein [Parvularcula maris]MCQ8185551.1 OmpH family outer membrane protein [Parvularcula maris]